MQIMENTLESLKAEKEELSHLRVTWKFQATEKRPVKQQWAAFKEQLKKVQKHAMLILNLRNGILVYVTTWRAGQ